MTTEGLFFRLPGVYVAHTELPRNFTTLSQAAKNHMFKLCLGRAVTWFLEGYLKLRFNAEYARRELLYEIDPGTRKNKERRSRTVFADAKLPNVWTGETRRMVLTTTRVRCVAARSRARAKIIINMPQYVNQQTTQVTNRCVRRITASEAEKIALKFFEEVNAASSRILSMDIKTRDGSMKTRSAAGSSDMAEWGRFDRGSTIIPRGNNNLSVAVGA